MACCKESIERETNCWLNFCLMRWYKLSKMCAQPIQTIHVMWFKSGNSLESVHYWNNIHFPGLCLNHNSLKEQKYLREGWFNRKIICHFWTFLFRTSLHLKGDYVLWDVPHWQDDFIFIPLLWFNWGLFLWCLSFFNIVWPLQSTGIGFSLVGNLNCST